MGSFIEAEQDHLDLRRAFRPGSPYVGVDLLDGRGVDRKADLLDQEAMAALVEELRPRVVLCLYVLEHVWEIGRAAAALGAMWKQNPESWIFVATHQNQPFHGTDHYGDFWRLTAPGLRRLMDESGIPDAKIFVLQNTSNPADIVAIRQPLSMSWAGEAMTKTVQRLEVASTSPTHWEQWG